MTTTKKIRPVEQYLMDTQDGWFFAKVVMYRQDRRTGEASDIIDIYEGLVKQHDCGIIDMVRPEANMRSRFKTTICTVSQRLISIEKVGA